MQFLGCVCDNGCILSFQAKAGFGLNVIGILIVTLGINTWGKAYYGLGQFPTWAVAAAAAGGNSTVAPHKCASQFPALIDGF